MNIEPRPGALHRDFAARFPPGNARADRQAEARATRRFRLPDRRGRTAELVRHLGLGHADSHVADRELQNSTRISGWSIVRTVNATVALCR